MYVFKSTQPRKREKEQMSKLFCKAFLCKLVKKQAAQIYPCDVERGSYYNITTP